MNVRQILATALLSAGLMACSSAVVAIETKPNLLLIAVDDLNDWVGCLGGHPDTQTPNIDRLAKRGVLFSNAHCQSTMCNPSRTSIMFGMRPSTTGLYNNLVNGAKSGALLSKHVSMPRHFAAGGYKTLTTGKIYHGSVLPNNHTVRTERWRYIRYADGSEELYDHETAPHEWTNLASDPGSKETLTRLKTHLPKTNAKQVPGKSRQLDKYRGTNGGNKRGQAEGALPLNKVEVSMHMVFPEKSEGKYYITGTTDLTNVWKGQTEGFHVYSSKDLKSWDKHLAWAPPEGSEWDSKAWGAIILPLEGKYVMMGAVYSSKRKAHGILTMEADQPEGPYTLRSDEPLMEGIDPHVVTDKDGSPWLVVGGLDAVKAAPLSKDLRSILVEPKTILHASKVPGAKGNAKALAKGRVRWFHDAPVFHRLANGELLMLFSANYEYPDGIAFATFKLRSKSGELSGPWKSEGVFLPKQHGASFWRRLDGELMLTVKPFGVSIEEGRPEFIRLKETMDDVSLHPDGSTE